MTPAMRPPRTFTGLLKELIRSLEAAAKPGFAHDPPWADSPYAFADDLAHLQRWVDSDEADKIWRAITGPQPFNSGDALAFVTYVLTVRQAAERVDVLNRKAALAGLTISDRLLSNRSDKDGSRRRTIFSRELSHHLRDLTGRWHDEEVGALCGIALGGEVDVRSARRESTRKRRR